MSARVDSEQNASAQLRKAPPAKRAKRKEKGGPEKQQEVGITVIVEEESRVYGYALLVAVLSTPVVLAISTLPLTKWAGAFPRVDERWGLFYWASLWIPTLACVCMFATSSHGPYCLPGKEIEGWKTALPCIVGMLVVGYSNFGLTYFLPKSLGAQAEFYYLDVIPMVLNVTVGVALTRELMKAYLIWTRKNLASSSSGNGSLALTGAEREGREEDSALAANKDEDAGLLQKLATDITNVVFVAFILFACESYCGAARPATLLHASDFTHAQYTLTTRTKTTMKIRSWCYPSIGRPRQPTGVAWPFFASFIRSCKSTS